MENPKIIKLNSVDQKILSVLLRNSRISLVELAKVIKHNYPTVRNRVNKLVENNIIKHFYPVLQFPGIGARRYMSIYLNLKNITKDEQKEIIKELVKHPFLIEVSELEGKWNISLLLVCNYIKEANETLEYIQQLCSNCLNDLVVMPTFTISNLNRRFFSDYEPNLSNVKTGYNTLISNTSLIHLSGALKLSNEDIKLLDYIKLNARDSLEDIGNAISIDPTLVDYKIKKMISTNLIKRFTIEVDSSVLGYEQYLLFLNLSGSNLGKKKLIEDLRNTKEAYHYFEYLNYWELVITFCVKNRDEMHKIFSNLQEKYKEYIKNHEILWLINKHKLEPYPDVSKIYGNR